VVAACREAGGSVLVTADHGNADDMGTPDDPDTAHTLNPVPLVYLTSGDASSEDRRVRPDGELADIAPTLLSLLGVEVPAAMTGETLLVDE
jgi:2,3-bisphosphoglycerate-independent phosphoglycerate mutase